MNKEKRWPFKIYPIQFIALGFGGVILLGSLLLTLPLFTRSGEETPFIDALFTATSATCVTGLTTLTTSEHWNMGGQLIILVLIEVGGLGFMMMPFIFFAVMKKKVGLVTRIILSESLNLDDLSGVIKLMYYILRFAIGFQLVGAILLAVDFIPAYGLAKGVWYSIFHSISAFCNAGFDLFGDSLVGFQDNAYVLLVISGLIVAGGLGFIVWQDLMAFRKTRRLSLHSKLALTVSIGLLIFGTVVFYISESGGRFIVSDTSPINRFANMLFMSVTARTAGYFSVDYGNVSQAGILFTIVLMFIGGTSGSTAGGLKTTTFGVLLIQTISMLKGRVHAEAFRRTIRPSVVSRALTLFFITLTLCIAVTMVMSVTEVLPRFRGIEYLLFETFSAFGTVGLTMGLTPSLSLMGKLLIIALMYIGRVGILTVGFSLTMRLMKAKGGHYKLPEESVIIG
ncbi:Trk family potassium uptake protein [Enterococcus hulanensis]|uniref:TrkH family potassium uptake protein n=1 Tax=Enterococcus hulanensis TaxID=2559929 RepID=A0ABU3F259_9ENTE|nr:TrkH family potassium uptake protein [Enterococcus hulanensis]MBO0457414.1 Trk family potassium uptake protein [Enterococcus hulanensis]MDT2601219.1 TrkH family potassium uptake protein [Enterococcus hulanensis]MDT2610871.1 TrkH family potassium uptake protein [Enterococcus hulanensis]MDT2618276.1 TrkH family potassium uptake protein [Enterococcus hulanensis]MDT2629154.1 TrkH family potassium uptake protein [Enterococcus hulanensis]